MTGTVNNNCGYSNKTIILGKDVNLSRKRSLLYLLWRMENIFINEGGFSLITGESGRGKSATLRLLEAKLSAHRDIEVGVITHPSASVSDFLS